MDGNTRINLQDIVSHYIRTANDSVRDGYTTLNFVLTRIESRILSIVILC
jgi:hypothetical protein